MATQRVCITLSEQEATKLLIWQEATGQSPSVLLASLIRKIGMIDLPHTLFADLRRVV
jgi:hypothetical protein